MDIRDPNLSVNLTAFRALQAEVAKLDAEISTLRARLNAGHAAGQWRPKRFSKVAVGETFKTFLLGAELRKCHNGYRIPGGGCATLDPDLTVLVPEK